MEITGDLLLGIIVVIGTILLSMTLHEVMHGWVAHRLGDDTAFLAGRLTLNPLKHIDPITTVAMPLLLYVAGLPPLGAAKPVPINAARLKYDEFGSALVGVAGPLTNLFLAVFFGLWLRLVPGLAQSPLAGVIELAVVVNIGFFVFNMVPFPPLDGSRVLYAFAPAPLQRIMETIERLGFMAILLFFFLIYPVVIPIVVQLVSGLTELIIGRQFLF